jgi:hypothetical protein
LARNTGGKATKREVRSFAFWELVGTARLGPGRQSRLPYLKLNQPQVCEVQTFHSMTARSFRRRGS